MSSIQTDTSSNVFLHPAIREGLAEFARRRVRLLTLRSISAGAISLIVTMSLVAMCDYFWILSDSVRFLLSTLAYGVSVGLMFRYGWHRADRNDLLRIARQFESADPGLHADLLSAVELADPQSANGSPRFRQWLQEQTGRRLAGIDVGQLLPVNLIRPWLSTAAVVLIAASVMTAIPQIQFGRRIARAMLPSAAIERASLTKIDITAPSPLTGPVAAGDAVGVVATISHADSKGCWLQWRTGTGAIDELPMNVRSETNAFSAILAVGQEPIDYRVLAGDAVTLWHRLTPVPRPRSVAFLKRYAFPDYALIDDQTVSEQDGDLKAVRGTVANLTVRLSEPCSEVAIRFIGGRRELQMKPTDSSNITYSIAIPINEPARYQVHAISENSGLESPQSEPFSIVPVADLPPDVTWVDSVESERIVSIMDVVSLQVQVTDEFPIDKVIHEYQVNDGPIVGRSLDVSEPSREIDLQWEWDLLNPQGDKSEQTKISSGDIVQTQVVSIDRRGHRGESTKRLLMVADQGFAPDRHARIERLQAAMEAVIVWTNWASETMSKEWEDVNASEPLQPTAPIRVVLSQLMETAATPAEAGRLELLAGAVANMEQEITTWFAMHASMTADDDSSWTDQREEIGRELSKAAALMSRDSKLIGNYGRDLLSHQLSLGLIDDASALTSSLQEVLAIQSPASRQARQLQIVDGWLTEIDKTFGKYRDSLSDSSQRLSDDWSSWRQQTSDRISQALKDGGNAEDQRAILEQLESELRTQQSDHSIYSRQVSVGLTNGVSVLSQQIGYVDQSLRELIDSGTQLDQATGRILGNADSQQIAGLNRQAKFYSQRFDDQRHQLFEQLDQRKELHTVHPIADLAFVADLGLMRRAIDHVTKEGFVMVADEPANVALGNLADAFRVLQSGHGLIQWRGELRALIDAEMDGSAGADFRFENPQRFDDYLAGMEWLKDRLNGSIIDHEIVPPTVHTKSQPEIQRTQQLLGSRRFDRSKKASARIPLRRIEGDVTAYLNLLEPYIQSARATLRRYAIPLHQLAREASEKVRGAIEATQSDHGSQEDLANEVTEADAATQETMEALVDLANTLVTADQQSRELARDADSALSQISRQRDRVNQAMQDDAPPSEMAAELGQLRERLDQTAEHFEKADSGQDLSESRQQMRRAEQDEQTSEKLDQRSARAEALAKAAERDAEELRQRLEKESQQNELMRDALSEIARKTAESALQSLKQSAEDERSLSRSLERADPNLVELKQRLTEKIASVARELTSLEQIFGSEASRIAKNNLDSSAHEELQNVRDSIRRAAESAAQVSRSDNLQSSIFDSAKEMTLAVRAARESIDKLVQAAQDSEAPELSERPRAAAAQDAERGLREVRDQQIRAANQEKRDWTKAKQNADRRLQQASRQVQELQKKLDDVKNDLDQESTPVPEHVLEMERRIADAIRAEQAAEESVADAKTQMNGIGERTDQLQNQSIEPMESENPNAEAVQRLSSAMRGELDSSLDALQEVGRQLQASPPLRVPTYVSAPLKETQQQIRDNIDDTGNELRRAALDEQRLGRDAAAEQLAKSATRVKQVAMSVATNAISELERNQVEPEAAPEAHRQVTDTIQGIQREADQLARLLGELPPGQDDGNEKSSDAEAERGKQLAKTLDELDQANAEQADGESKSNQTAGEASPTLQQAMDQAAREAAKERRQQIGPGQNEGQNPEGPPSTSAAQNPQSGSGQGKATDEGRVATDGIDRDGSDWGQLQTRRPGDASGLQQTRGPARYRRHIEAYFRAIAERSAEVDQ